MKKLKLHLGCGKRNFGSDWVHIDGGKHSHINSHDIVNLPYENNTVDLIYASHVFEYFDRDEGTQVLYKWLNVLKPNGILRLAVPNFGEMARLYIIGGISLDCFLGPLYGKMRMDDESGFIYHKTTYDMTSLIWMLAKVGFVNIHPYNWRETEHADFDDHSQAYIPHMNKTNGALISLNVEAQKENVDDSAI